jgi:large subunit ribosomal protein L18
MLKSIQLKKNRVRAKRKKRVRGKISGTADIPRVSIFKSNKHVYAQAIDDTKGFTIASADGRAMKLKANREDAKKVAQALASSLKEKGIDTAVFDRNGYLYHGVIASFADALREAGIKL